MGVYLKEDFLGADIADGFDELRAVGLFGMGEPGHGQLYHLDLRLLGLPAAVHEEDDLLVELAPFLGIVAEGDLRYGHFTMSFRMRTEVKCSLLMRAFFSFYRRR